VQCLPSLPRRCPEPFEGERFQLALHLALIDRDDLVEHVDRFGARALAVSRATGFVVFCRECPFCASGRNNRNLSLQPEPVRHPPVPRPVAA
jgi:hypothetical protein